MTTEEKRARELLAEAYGSIGMEHTGDRLLTHGPAIHADEAALIAIAAALRETAKVDAGMGDNREGFESWVAEYTGEPRPKYHYGHGYVGTIPNRYRNASYADIDLLWQAWQAAQAFQRARLEDR